MAISYPLTPPSSPKPSQVEFIQANVVQYSKSPFTLQGQVQEWDGSGWNLRVSFPYMSRDEAAPWIAFLTSLRGRRGTFTFGSTLRSSPQGAAGGTPKVDGGSQTGFELDTDGWPLSTLVLKADDFIQIDTSLYTVLSDVTSDGSGAATIDLWPRLRSHADNADIETSSPVGLFRLTSNNSQVIEATNKLYSIGFEAEEAL